MSNVEYHRAAHEEFNRGDLPAMSARLTADAVYTDHARRMSLKGPDEFIGWVSEWRTAMSDAAATDAEYIDGGDWSIARFIGRGTNDGPMAGMPATGRRLELDFCELLRFTADGKIVQGDMYYDVASLMAQLGVSPEASSGQ